MIKEVVEIVDRESKVPTEVFTAIFKSFSFGKFTHQGELRRCHHCFITNYC